MSLLKAALAFVISSLFIISLYLTINSYTLGNLLQKENVKSFIQSQASGDMAISNCEDMCSSRSMTSQCDSFCTHVSPELQSECRDECQKNANSAETRQTCIDSCVSRANESQQYASDYIDDAYSKEIVSGLSLEQISGLFSNSLLLLIISAILGLSLFLVAEKPVSKMGSSLIWIAVSVLFVAAIPVVVIKPNDSVMKTVSEYIFSSLYQQLYIAIALLAAGIVLVVIGKKKNK
jgi:hypothetical protein